MLLCYWVVIAQAYQQRRQSGKRHLVVDLHVPRRASGHGRRNRIDGILNYRPATTLLHREEAGRAIVKVTGEDDTNHIRPKGESCRTKQRINGRSCAILLGSTAQANSSAGLDQHVMTRWRQ